MEGALKLMALPLLCLLIPLLSAQEVEWEVPESVHSATADRHPEYLHIPMSVPNSDKTVTIKLRRNDGLFTDNYRTRVAGEDGTVVRSFSRPSGEHSVYHDLDSTAAFTVRGYGKDVKLEGVFEHEGVLHTVSHVQKRHAETSMSHEVMKAPLTLVGDDYIMPSDLEIRKQVEALWEKLGKDVKTNEASHGRQKRAAPNYEIELLILVDFEAYSRFYENTTMTDTAAVRQAQALAEMEYYFVHLANYMDLRYQTITDMPWTIRLRLTELHFASTQSTGVQMHTIVNSTAGVTPQEVVAVTGYELLNSFIAANEGSFNTFDHAMLFTGYELTSYNASGFKSSSVAGLAAVGAICNSQRTSINELGGALLGAAVGAHELGHNLLAAHDGTGNACSAADQFIMAPSTGPTNAQTHANYFRFSSCSKVYFTEVIDNLNGGDSNCMINTATSITAQPDVPPGQRYSVDELCRQALGDGWTYFGGTAGRDICTELRCLKPDGSGISIPGGGRGIQGTTCGNKKWCQLGVCTPDDAAPAGSDDCPLGDRKGVIVGSSTCAQIVAVNCYTDLVESECCATCPAFVKAGLPSDCKYGDRLTGCGTINAGNAFNCYGNAAEDGCCETCAGLLIPGLPDSCRYGNHIDCPTTDPAQCTNPAVASSCCQLCAPPTTPTTTAAPTTSQPTTQATTAATTMTTPAVPASTAGAPAVTASLTMAATGTTTTPMPTCDLVCQNGGQCELSAGNQQSCSCVAGYGGTLCEKSLDVPTAPPTTATATNSGSVENPPTIYRTFETTITITSLQGEQLSCASLNSINANRSVYDARICAAFVDALEGVAACSVNGYSCGSLIANTTIFVNSNATNATMANDAISQLLQSASSPTGLIELSSITVSQVDECAVGTHACSPAALCVDLPGSYECLCPTGTHGDLSTGATFLGALCTETCLPGLCQGDGVCTETPGGSANCSCTGTRSGNRCEITDGLTVDQIALIAGLSGGITLIFIIAIAACLCVKHGAKQSKGRPTKSTVYYDPDSRESLGRPYGGPHGAPPGGHQGPGPTDYVYVNPAMDTGPERGRRSRTSANHPPADHYYEDMYMHGSSSKRQSRNGRY